LDFDDKCPNGKTAYVNKKNTEERISIIKSKGYNVRTFWECDVRNVLKQDVEMKTFFDEKQPKV